MEKRLAILIMVCGIALGATLLVLRAQTRFAITHDEGVTYLAATGHQGRYATDKPSARWVEAAAWKSYWTPDEFGAFRRIGRDLARYDLHPPLYFWVLHAWIQVTGVGPASGALLNLVFLALACVVIFVTCRLGRCSPGSSAAAAVMWLLSGATLSVGDMSRQYCLLGLAASAFAATALFFLKRRSRVSALLLSLSVLGGLLVHYQFAMLGALGIAFAAILLLRTHHTRAVALLLASAALAGIAFVILHPWFTESFVALRRFHAHTFLLSEVPQRLTKSIVSLLRLVMRAQWAHGIAESRVAVVLLLFLAVLGTRWYLKEMKCVARGPGSYSRSFLPLVAITASAGIIASYVMQFVPRWAMAPNYLMTVSPLLFMVGAQLFDRLTLGKAWRWVLVPALLASQAIYGGWTTREVLRTAALERRNGYVDRGAPIILDSVASGVLPTVLWHARERTPVYAASQDELLNRFPRLPEGAATLSYISDARYGNSVEKRARILERFARAGYRVTARRGSVFGVGQVYELGRSP